jgi:hypothetical protein
MIVRSAPFFDGRAEHKSIEQSQGELNQTADSHNSSQYMDFHEVRPDAVAARMEA